MNSPLDPLEKSIRALKAKKIHIHSLRFPYYRNLEPNAELIFDFPITVLLGRNGTNKSSILHALYGSVRGKSIGNFWFETRMDPIQRMKNGLYQSVIHRYFDEDKDELVECLKLCYTRRGDPEYWEPGRHVLLYGFKKSGVRVRPIRLHVRHLDFRGELPAFDKYFYFPDPKHLAERDRDRKKKIDSTGRIIKYSKQDYLRSRSSKLKKEIEKSGVDLTNYELKIIRYALERNYVSGKLLKHNIFHGHEGWTILFETGDFGGYSDAFAGSGESAATILIHNIMDAPDGSLILLDEPETSLHPRAQQRILEFIAHQAVRKSLQVVIATHSTYLAQKLPQEAIRVLIREQEGFVVIKDSYSADEALHEVATLAPGKTILVEDERARRIVMSALELSASHTLNEFSVLVRPGGTARIYRDIQSYANSGRKDVFIIFDGDHDPQKIIPKDDALPQGKKGLEDLIKDFTFNENKKGLSFVDVGEMTRYLSFLREQVFFLPTPTPEHLVWDEAAAAEIFGEELPQEILQEANLKERLRLLADKVLGFDSEVVFSILLNKFLEGDSQEKLQLLKVIQQIRKAST
ncbi:AAA family ATPase [Leptothoe sp. LEGE 181152]|nr:AAA family ATPase [Leptothoe sp. LEGE 181152]